MDNDLFLEEINAALRHFQIARDHFMLHHGGDFDSSYFADHFNYVVDAIERLREECVINDRQEKWE